MTVRSYRGTRRWWRCDPFTTTRAARPLPWLAWFRRIGGGWVILGAAGLAFVNVVLPLCLLRLVAGRRRFSMRALMALPVAAAIPLMCFLILEPELPAGSTPLLATEKRLFTAVTVAGVPIVFLVIWTGTILVRCRWKPLLALAALTVLMSLAIAAGWCSIDARKMSTLERYDRAGWYLVALPGAYGAAILVLLARFGLVLGSLLRRGPRAARPVGIDSEGESERLVAGALAAGKAAIPADTKP